MARCRYTILMNHSKHGMTENLILESEPVQKTASAVGTTGVVVAAPTYEVFSSGGGTQSTAMAALIVQGKLPKPDIMAIVDTGREMPTTWEYMDKVTIPEMKKIGIEVYRVKAMKYANKWGHPSLAGWSASGTLMLPMFSSINNSKLSAYCSKAWKQEAMNLWLKQEHGLTRKEYRKWIGFSFDETRRVLNMQRGEEWKRGLIRFPLVHDVPTKRHQAIRLVEQMGWPTPPRSRCWMCPNQSDMEWHEVQEDYLKLYAEAIRLDEEIRETDANAYLHNSIKPLKDVDLTQIGELDPMAAILFGGTCESGECFL